MNPTRKLFGVILFSLLFTSFFISSTTIYSVIKSKNRFEEIYNLISTNDTLIDNYVLPKETVLVDNTLITWDSLRSKITKCDCNYDLKWEALTPKDIKGGPIQKIVYAPLYFLKAKPTFEVDHKVFYDKDLYLKCRILDI